MKWMKMLLRLAVEVLVEAGVEAGAGGRLELDQRWLSRGEYWQHTGRRGLLCGCSGDMDGRRRGIITLPRRGLP